jgi:hypothetical protein
MFGWNFSEENVNTFFIQKWKLSVEFIDFAGNECSFYWKVLCWRLSTTIMFWLIVFRPLNIFHFIWIWAGKRLVRTHFDSSNLILVPFKKFTLTFPERNLKHIKIIPKAQLQTSSPNSPTIPQSHRDAWKVMFRRRNEVIATNCKRKF